MAKTETPAPATSRNRGENGVRPDERLAGIAGGRNVYEAHQTLAVDSGCIHRTFVPVWAEEASKEAGGKPPATVTAKPLVCPRLVPVSVTPSQNHWSPDEAEALNKLEVPGQIELAVPCELDRQGYALVKTFELKITILEFALRSGDVTVMSGISPAVAAASGPDKLTVNVSVQTAGGDGFGFDVKAKLGRMFAPSPSQRVNTLAQDVAKTIVTKVKKKGFLKEG